MKNLIILSLILANFNLAYSLDIQSLNVDLQELQFKGDKGNGLVRSLEVEMNEKNMLASPAYPIQIIKTGSVIKIKTLGITMTWNDIPSWLQGSVDLDLTNTQIYLGIANDHSFKLETLNLNQPELGSVTIRGIEATCQNSLRRRPLIKQLPQDCLKKANIKASELNIPMLNNFLSAILVNQSTPQVANNILVDVEDNKYQLSLNPSIVLGPGVYSYGEVEEFDDVKKTIKLRIDSVKFGYLPITPIVFKELKKRLPPEKFKVERPYIYINF